MPIFAYSFYYNLRHGLWKKDIVFTVMEPLLIVIFLLYFIPGISLRYILESIHRWAGLYITLQGALIVVKLIVGYNMTSTFRSRLERLKYLVAAFPRLEASFSLNDLSMLGVSNLSQPTKDEYLLREMDFNSRKIRAISSHNYADYGIAKKDESAYHNQIDAFFTLDRFLGEPDN